MKDVISDDNFLCEKVRSKSHIANTLMFLISILSVVPFVMGCWLFIEQIQIRMQWASGLIMGPLRAINFAPSIILFVISVLLAFFVFRPFYLWTYWEGEDDGRYGDTVGHCAKERVSDYSQSWVTLNTCSEPSRCAAEYLLNAITQPKTVYLRIKEELKPSARTLAVETRLDIAPLSQTCCYDRERDDYVENPEGMGLGGSGGGCSDSKREVLVPVVYQKRGELANHLRVQDRSGNPLPTCQTAEVADLLVEILRPLVTTDELEKLEKLDKYRRELADTTKPMDKEVVKEVRSILRNAGLDSRTWKLLDQAVYLLSTCYVLCVRVTLDINAKDVSSLCTHKRMPLRLKPQDFVRQLDATGNQRRMRTLILKVNDCINGMKKSSGVFFYNLSNANLAQSYHLMMLGPDDTFCARGDVLETPCVLQERNLEAKRPSESNFKCERLRGQRHAHILWGQAENYHRAAFMFHYVGRPQDLFFAAGLMALVCLVGLVVTMLGSVDAAAGGKKLGTDIPAVLLLALSAICPWLYDRERNDRTESFLLDLSAFLTTVESITGLLLFLDSSLKLGIVSSDFLPDIWRLLIVFEAVDAASLLFLSTTHNSLYKARRLNRIDRSYGIFRLLNAVGWRNTSVFRDFEDSFDWLYRLLHGHERACQMVAGVNGGLDNKCCGPYVASLEWPKGWLAVPGSFWWESERSRWTDEQNNSVP